MSYLFFLNKHRFPPTEGVLFASSIWKSERHYIRPVAFSPVRQRVSGKHQRHESVEFVPIFVSTGVVPQLLAKGRR